jgi:WD40 repeat protein
MTVNLVWKAAFSPDGTRVITASYDKTARLWDTATGNPIAVLHGHEDRVNSVVTSRDGTRIVTGSDDKTA